MSKARKPSRPPARPAGRFTLGGEQAEADPLLIDGFYSSIHYATLVAKTDPSCFIVGRTGVGKSAALTQIATDYPQHCITISPEDLSLPYITDLTVMHYLDELNVKLDPLFIALWKHVLLIEIIKNRYNVENPTAKQNFLVVLKEKILRDRSKMAALEYLEEFEGRFWCETNERVKNITESFEKEITAAAGGKLEVPALGSGSLETSGSSRQSKELATELTARFQRIVNETQLPRLNKMINVLDEDILDSPQHYTYIVIDDLDRDWVDERISNALIRCLFRAVIDLKRVQNLKVLVALRTNIFVALDFGARTGGQEEKFRSLSLDMRWTRNDLEQLLSERTRAAAALHGIPDVNSIKDLLPATNKTRGNALDFILRRTLMRPRDAIAYINECLSQSGRPKITWDNIHAAERDYSMKRLLALRDEWKTNYVGVDEVFQVFEGAPVVMDRAAMTKLLDEAALCGVEGHQCETWLSPLVEQIWLDATRSWVELYAPLLRLLFEMGFIGCVVKAGGRSIYLQDDANFGTLQGNFEKVISFDVHPAFRSALDVGSENHEG